MNESCLSGNNENGVLEPAHILCFIHTKLIHPRPTAATLTPVLPISRMGVTRGCDMMIRVERTKKDYVYRCDSKRYKFLDCLALRVRRRVISRLHRLIPNVWRVKGLAKNFDFWPWGILRQVANDIPAFNPERLICFAGFYGLYASNAVFSTISPARR